MKKFLFLMVTLFSAITMSAKDDVTVKSGSLAEVKAAGNSFVFIVCQEFLSDRQELLFV